MLYTCVCFCFCCRMQMRTKWTFWGQNLETYETLHKFSAPRELLKYLYVSNSSYNRFLEQHLRNLKDISVHDLKNCIARDWTAVTCWPIKFEAGNWKFALLKIFSLHFPQAFNWQAAAPRCQKLHIVYAENILIKICQHMFS